jgi:hypothetical protein
MNTATSTLMTVLIALAPKAGMSKECREKLDQGALAALTALLPAGTVFSASKLNEYTSTGDLSPDDDPCFNLTRGDFDGNGLTDYGILVQDGNILKPKAVVLLTFLKKYKAVILPSWCGSPACRISTSSPGKYERTASLDSSIKKSSPEMETMIAKHDVLLIRAMEQSEVAHALIDGRWRYVWVSD